jgi:hypothetical protein
VARKTRTLVCEHAIGLDNRSGITMSMTYMCGAQDVDSGV